MLFNFFRENVFFCFFFPCVATRENPERVHQVPCSTHIFSVSLELLASMRNYFSFSGKIVCLCVVSQYMCKLNFAFYLCKKYQINAAREDSSRPQIDAKLLYDIQVAVVR